MQPAPKTAGFLLNYSNSCVSTVLSTGRVNGKYTGVMVESDPEDSVQVLDYI